MWGSAVLAGLFLLSVSSPSEAAKPLSQIVKSVENQGYLPVEVELEDGVWEIDATKDGKAFELVLDPESAETLKIEQQDEEDDREEDADDGQGEEVAAADAAKPVETPLSQLEWLIGEWVDEGADSTIKTRCAWTKRRHFITRSFTVEGEGQVVLEGTQVIAWDPIYQRIRSWMFDSEGGFSSGVWIEDGDHWDVKVSHTLATGERASAINVLTYVDEDTVRWKSINREIEGEIQPSISEVTIVRRAAE
jgi:hypothetical protein